MSEPRAAAGRFSGVRLILLATVIAGISGYVTLGLVAGVIGPDRYVAFSVFWGTLYLLVGTLSGIQQEVSRATYPLEESAARSAAGAHVARNFGIVATVLVGVVVGFSAPLWMPVVLPGSSPIVAVAIAVGAAGYTVVATLCGTLYGLNRWAALAWLIGLDGVLRLIAVGLALLSGGGEDALAIATAMPFPITLILVWLVIRRGVVGRSQLDVGYKALSWNVARTLLAAASMAALISGFPTLMGATSAGEDPAQLATLLLVITLTRAPLVIPVLALQSFLIVKFKDRSGNFWRVFFTAIGGILAVAVVAALLAAAIGPWLVQLVFGTAYAVDGVVLGVIVVSGGVTAALCASGPAVLALGKHGVYTAGWVLAALTTIAALMLPLDLVLRTELALLLGPAVGLLVHTVYLVTVRRSRSVAAEPVSDSDGARP